MWLYKIQASDSDCCKSETDWRTEHHTWPHLDKSPYTQWLMSDYGWV